MPAIGPLILAGNHASWLDGPLVVAECDRLVRCLTKVELYGGRLGWYLALIGQIPIDRGRPDRTALHASLEELQSGGAIGMFPEGTRGTRRARRGARRGGVAGGAVRRKVVPVACLGTAAALPKGAKFPKRTPVTVVFGEPFRDHDAGQPAFTNRVQGCQRGDPAAAGRAPRVARARYG